MKTEICSRAEIESKTFPPNTALITITDWGSDFVVLHNSPDHILRLEFDDVGNEIFEEFEDNFNRKPTEAEKAKLIEKYHMLNDEQTGMITDFVSDVLRKGNIQLFVCQCEYGVSRSSALMASIKKFLNNSCDNGVLDIFVDYRYEPNKYIYHKVLNALLCREGGK